MKPITLLLAVLLLPGCISISAHQKELRQAKEEQLRFAEDLAFRVRDGKFDAIDMVHLIEYRRERIGHEDR